MNFTVSFLEVVFDDFQQIRNVFLFWCEAQSHNIVAAFHQLQTLPFYISVRHSRWDTKTFTFLQSVVLKQTAYQ